MARIDLAVNTYIRDDFDELCELENRKTRESSIKSVQGSCSIFDSNELLLVIGGHSDPLIIMYWPEEWLPVRLSELPTIMMECTTWESPRPGVCCTKRSNLRASRPSLWPSITVIVLLTRLEAVSPKRLKSTVSLVSLLEK